MNISNAHNALPAVVRPGTHAWESMRARPDGGVGLSSHPDPSGGDEPIDEALVELPHVLLHLSHLEEGSPRLAEAGHAAVAGLALLRATQSFGVKGVDAKLEGASALALAVSSAASSLHGKLAHGLAHGALGVHGAIEAGLGAHEALDAWNDPESSWLQVADGALGVVKGLATVTPLVVPGVEHVSHLVELGAILGRAGLKLAPQVLS